MALLGSLLAAIGCGPSTPDTLAVEGTVLAMGAASASQHVQGKPPAGGVRLVIRPERVLAGDEPLDEAAWRTQLAAAFSKQEDAWVFTQLREPLPAVQPVGTPVRATVDPRGFLIAVEPLAAP